MSEQVPKTLQQNNPPAQKNTAPQEQQIKSVAPSKQPAVNKKQAYTGYRLYEKTQFRTDNQLRDRRQKAILSKEISLALFGRRRFKRIEIVSSLNNLYATLLIATIFHKRVVGLYLIIELEKLQYVEFADSNDTQGQAKENSLFRLTLTKYPTEKDRSSVGFNEAFKAQDIANPIDGLLQRKHRKRNQNHRQKKPRNQERERKDRQQRPRRQKDMYQKQRNYIRQSKRNNRNEYKDRPQRQDRERKAKRQKDEYQDRTRKYRDRDEERRDYKQSNQSYRKYQPKEQKQEESKNKQKRQDEGNYRRGQTRSRGTVRIAPHNYESSHIRNDDRGQRNPRRNRYSDDEN